MAKAYWNMTTDELEKATREFDCEFAADNARPLSAAMKARWERAKAKGQKSKNGPTEQTIAVRLEPGLLRRCTALAKRKRVSRDVLIARGLRALLDSEHER
jgi:hypothetical protein